MQEKGLLFSNCTIVDKELFFVETYYGLPAKMNPESGDVSYFEAMENFSFKGKGIVYRISGLWANGYMHWKYRGKM